MIRTYIPDTFYQDARDGMDSGRADAERGAYSPERNAAILSALEKIESAPPAKRGRGTGRWVELTRLEAEFIAGEATYRREYWLTDAYGPEDIQPHERTAGRAAQRLETFLREALAN